VLVVVPNLTRLAEAGRPARQTSRN
jgi:hypothetical protein